MHNTGAGYILLVPDPRLTLQIMPTALIQWLFVKPVTNGPYNTIFPGKSFIFLP